MTHVELSPVDVTQSETEEYDDRTAPAPPPKRGGLGRNIFLGVLALSVAAALLIAWSRWGSFDPNMGSQARDRAHIQFSPAEHPLYFWMLLGHIMGSSIALAAGVFQLVRGIRDRYPRVHRYTGRVYVFAGVIPAVFFALVVEAFWPFSTVTAVSQVALAVLWGFVTIVGFRFRRQGRIEDHRRWMLRSYALTASVLVELAINPFVELLISTQFHTRLNGSMDIYMQAKDSTENWLGLIIVILVVEGYLEREQLRRSRRRMLAEAGKSTVDA
jgi:uncharacterized membrane protein